MRTKALSWFSYAACGWMMVSVFIHIYWALGGSAGLPSGMLVPDNTPLFVIDLIAIPLSIIGAALALALSQPWGRRFSQRLLRYLAWGTAALLVFHALPTVIEALLIALGQRSTDLSEMERFSMFLYEPFWLLGGIIWTFVAWTFQRASSTTIEP